MISLEVAEKLPQGWAEKISMASDVNRERISGAMGTEVRTVIVEHLANRGQQHPTAGRLGGTPTGFITGLANNFDQVVTVSVDANGVSLRMRHPTISRAYHDITITGSPWLTLPMNAPAYGHRVGEFDHFILLKPAAGGGDPDKKPKERQPLPTDVPVFLLVHSVTQWQDPTLMPTADQINTAASLGAVREVKAIAAENRS